MTRTVPVDLQTVTAIIGTTSKQIERPLRHPKVLNDKQVSQLDNNLVIYAFCSFLIK